MVVCGNPDKKKIVKEVVEDFSKFINSHILFIDLHESELVSIGNDKSRGEYLSNFSKQSKSIRSNSTIAPFSYLSKPIVHCLWSILNS